MVDSAEEGSNERRTSTDIEEERNVFGKAAETMENLSKFKKASKLKTAYMEINEFADSNLHEGYFCYNCIYWLNMSGGRCVIVDNEGSDTFGNVSNVIAPHGWCNAYEPNIDRLNETRSSTTEG